MKEIKVKLYSFDELSDDAKEKAIEEQRENHCEDFWDSVREEIDALEDIADAMGATINDYSLDTCSPSYIEFKFNTYDFDFEDLKDIRALKYIYNNFISPFIKGKHYSIWKQDLNGKYITKYKQSKAIFEFTPASGLYIDNIVLDVYEEYIENIKKHISFNVADFIEDVESRLAKTIVDNAEYNDSNEVWKERLLDDVDEIYTEEGKIY